MKRINLSDEEARHIEQRRDNEKRGALGYNQALIDINAWLDDFNDEGVSITRLRDHMNSLRKLIR